MIISQKNKQFLSLVLFLLLYPFTLIMARIPLLQFENINIEDGLSHSKVNTVIMDSRGFIWFGTNDGVNRYDGYQIVEYQHNPEDSTSLSHNLIRFIYEDTKGRLWIATDAGGLNLYCRDQNQFKRFMHNPDDPKSISSDNVNYIVEDSKGNLWIATRNGLNHLDIEKEEFKRYFHQPGNANSLNSNHIQSLEIEPNDKLWIGTIGGGVNTYDPQLDQWTHYHPESSIILESWDIFSLCRDNEGNLWIGTEWDGLYRFDPKTNHFELIPGVNMRNIRTVRDIMQSQSGNIWIGSRIGLYIYDPKSGDMALHEYGTEYDFSISHSSILCIYEDKNRDVWIGTRKGANYFVRHKAAFRSYFYFPQDSRYLNDQVVYAIHSDDQGDLWIGTEKGGLNYLNRRTGEYTYYRTDNNNPYSLSRNNIKTISQDQNGDLWIGTFRGGLNRMDIKTKRFYNYSNYTTLSRTHPRDEVFSIIIDYSGKVWCATNSGVGYFQPDKEKIFYYNHDSENSSSLSHDDCRVIYRDSHNTIWVGTFNGLNRFNPESESFTRYFHDPEDETCLSNSFIQSLYEDSHGRFWIGTQGGGLNLMNQEKGTFQSYTEKDGLANNTIYGILEDDDGNLWLSTNQGLSKFNPDKGDFRNYDRLDGLISNQFTYNAYHKNQDGEMFFGSVNGFISFYPDQIEDNTYIPPIVITDLKIFNRSVSSHSENSPLSKSIMETNEIVLSYKQSVITIEFASLNFAASEKNQYAYKLEGFEDDWNYVGTKRTASFTNLSHGTYTFRVKGSNNHGYWNEEGASLKIIITPPFYQTLWFRIVASLLIVLGIVFIFRLRMAGMLRRNRLLESINQKLNQQIRERKRAEKKIQNQLAEKEILLKEIHHRVKNNLQIIVSLLRLQSTNIKDDKMLEILKESRERVRSMALVHERLYRTENLADIDFSEYIPNLIEELGRAYHVDPQKVEFDVQCETVSLSIDYAVPCGLILNELISNCLKHAFPAGWEGERKIAISLSHSADDILHLVVADTGKGLPSEFNPRNSDSLGLKLVYILVEDQMGGDVKVKLEKGTSFHIQFSGLE